MTLGARGGGDRSPPPPPRTLHFDHDNSRCTLSTAGTETGIDGDPLGSLGGGGVQ